MGFPYTWPVSRRRRWTPTTSRRYQALASESLTGEVPSVAAATEAATLAASRTRPSSARSAALARTGAAAIAPSTMRGERHHGAAFRLDARELSITERVGVGRTLAGDGEDERAREAITPGEKLIDRRVARAITALHRNGRVECKQGDREIAEWRWREQVAADGAHVAHGRSADRTRDGMQKRELALGENARESDAGANRDAGAGDVEVRQGAVCRQHHRRNRDIAFIERAHDQRTAAEVARVALRRQRRCCFSRRREGLHGYGHDVASALIRSPADAGESPRSRPGRSVRRPSQ